MAIVKNFQNWLAEAVSGEIFKPRRNSPVKIDPKKHPELSSEFFDLISTAYAEIGGHANIKSPSDVFADSELTFWEGIDIHGTNDFDIVIFGKNTKYGIKYAGIGHDGTFDAKKAYLDMRGKSLKEIGHYIEVSGKLADILIKKYGVPVVNDQAEVEKVLGKKIDWLGEKPGSAGDGWYTRMLAGSPHDKILIGRPKI